MKNDLRREALDYHARGPAGKMQTLPTKPMTTQHDLALAYSPGVAYPCEEIAADPAAAALYTMRSHTVAVISNGTAVLGLGNIGALASKPVMEGKAALFKKFSGLDCVDLEVDETDPAQFIEAVARLEPSFGGINLEDIKAPECFVIEKALKERMGIPVFHDDQHGTAIVTAAGILNALLLVDKRIGDVRIVANGAGAASLACLDLLVSFGASKDNIIVCDSKGPIHTGRGNLDQYKGAYAAKINARDLAEAMVGSDIFLGLSVAGAVSKDMVASMADKPIIFAMANPEPEIRPELVKEVRSDAIIATGRSDYPNQVNNVLCFPFIFRGALDCGATEINEDMKRACAIGIAELTRKAAPHTVLAAYGIDSLKFGPEYIIPKPFDTRLMIEIAPLVAEAAIKSGVAARPIEDMSAYRDQLRQHVFRSGLLMKPVFDAAMRNPARIAFAEGVEDRVLHCAEQAIRQGIAKPILVGSVDRIAAKIKDLGFSLKIGEDVEVADPHAMDRTDLADYLHRQVGRDGVNLVEAERGVRNDRTVLASLLLKHGNVDAVICGVCGRFGHQLDRVEAIIGRKSGVRALSTLNALVMPKGTIFITDAYANLDPSAEDIADSAMLSAETMRSMGVTPRAALISHSNFGDRPSPSSQKMRQALTILRDRSVDFEVDGEMGVGAALDPNQRERAFAHSVLRGPANLLVMPNADAAHVSLNLLREMGEGVSVGPILMGVARPIHIASQSVTVRGLLNLTALATVEASRSSE